MNTNVKSWNRKSLTAATIASTLLLMGAGAGCSSGNPNTAAEYEKNPIVHQVSEADVAAARSKEAIAGDSVVLWVNGLGCPLCASNIDKQLVRVKGVKSVAVDLGQGRVSLELKPGEPHPSPARLGEAVEDAGFTLVKVETK